MNGMPPLVPVLKRNLLPALATFTSVVGASYLYLKATPPTYQASARLILDDRRVSVSDLGQALAVNPATGTASPMATQAELITSERVLQRAITLLAGAKLKGKELTTGSIGSGIKVKIVPATNILELVYSGSDPKTVETILNAIAQATVQESGESIRQQASTVRQFVEERVPKQQALLTQVEAAESQFKEQNGITSLEEQDRTLINSLATVEDQTRLLTAQLQEAQQKSGQLQGIIGSSNVQSAYVASRAGQDEELKQLREKLLELETQVIDARARLGDEHPDLLALVQKRDESRKLYEQSLARVVPQGAAVPTGQVAADDLSRGLIATYITSTVEQNALVERLNSLKGQGAPIRAQLSTLPAKQRVLASLIRKREQEAATLKRLQDKLEEARIAEAQLISNIRIIKLADVPSSPSGAKPGPTLLIGVVAGLASAIAIILLGEMLNRKVGSTSELEDQLKLPVLGVLPKRLPIEAGQLAGFLNDPDAVEPYRRLLKMLELSHKGELKSLLISSSVKGEGKSSVAAHLAIVAATLSKRTLLIDADLSIPLQHQFFNVPEQPGLTNVVGEKIPLQSVVQPTQLDNLHVLTHGQMLTRSSAVLEAEAMKALIKTAMDSYDLVIVDTSPVGRYADAMTLSQQADATVLVVRPEFSPKAVVQRSISDLQRSSTSLLGCVVNPTGDPTPNRRSPENEVMDFDNERLLSASRSISSSI
jgi:polysaccharide biosynthesis transport protein